MCERADDDYLSFFFSNNQRAQSVHQLLFDLLLRILFTAKFVMKLSKTICERAHEHHNILLLSKTKKRMLQRATQHYETKNSHAR